MTNGRPPTPVRTPNETTSSETVSSTTSLCFWLSFFLLVIIHITCQIIVMTLISNKYTCDLNTLQSRPRFESQTVVVENPMSVDSSGKLVITISFLFLLVLDIYFWVNMFNPYRISEFWFWSPEKKSFDFYSFIIWDDYYWSLPTRDIL